MKNALTRIKITFIFQNLVIRVTTEMWNSSCFFPEKVLLYFFAAIQQYVGVLQTQEITLTTSFHCP